MSNAAGIDVSNHNETVDWSAWRGQAFAFAKATEGTRYRDPYFGRNWAGMASAGLIRGAYGFAHPANDPAEDARYFLDYVRVFGLRETDLLALDLEVDDGLSPQAVSRFAQAWCQWIRAQVPNRLLVYTYRNFAAAGNCAGLGTYPLWIADPGVLPGQPRVPAPWDTWHIHQHGVIGGIDRDVYNGDTPALEAFAGGDGMLTDDDVRKITNAVKATVVDRSGVTIGQGIEAAVQARDGLAELRAKVDEILTALQPPA